MRGSAPDIDPRTASVLYDAGGIANLMTAFPNAVYTVAVAIVVRRTSVFPAWIGYGALLVDPHATEADESVSDIGRLL